MNKTDYTPISRVNRTREEARTSYNTMSRWYDLMSGPAEGRYKKIALQQLDVQPGDKVLEIGSGTGKCLVGLSRCTGDGGIIAGIDLSDGMLHVTRRRIEKAGSTGNVVLSLADAADLPFQSGCFDAVFMTFTLELFDTPEIPVVLHECRRVLSDWGRMGIAAMGRKSRPGVMVRLYEWAHQRFPRAVDCRPIDVCSSLEDAGFHVERMTEKRMFGLPVDIVLAGVQ